MISSHAAGRPKRAIVTVLAAVAGLLLSAAAQAETLVNTDTLRLVFADNGDLESAIACFPACTGERPRIQQVGDDGVVRIGTDRRGSSRLAESRTETHQELRWTGARGAELTWRIPLRGYRLELVTGSGELALYSGVSFRPREAPGFGAWLEQVRYLTLNDGAVQQFGFDDVGAEPETDPVADAAWLGFRNRFWAVAAAPPSGARAFFQRAEGREDAAIGVANAAGEWSFYLGPIEPRALKTADAQLDRLMFAGLWFWLRWICFGFFHLLGAIAPFLPSWGLAIMALSVVVSLVMFPLTRIAERLQQDVQETEARLAPEMQRIKQKYKGEEQSVKILALYKEENVHPLYSLKGMMGLALVIPVFIGAFNMLAENINLLDTAFLWMADLSGPDSLFTLPFRLPFFGADLNLLPVLMTGLSVWASALHHPPTDNPALRKKQVRNMALMALAFFVLFYTFPAGMVLYWTTNNAVTVARSLWARR